MRQAYDYWQDQPGSYRRQRMGTTATAPASHDGTAGDRFCGPPSRLTTDHLTFAPPSELRLESCELCRPHVHHVFYLLLLRWTPTRQTDKTRRRRTSRGHITWTHPAGRIRRARRRQFVTPSESPLTGSDCTRQSQSTRTEPSYLSEMLRTFRTSRFPTRGASHEHAAAAARAAAAHYPAGHLLLRHRVVIGRTTVILQYRNLAATFQNETDTARKERVIAFAAR